MSDSLGTLRVNNWLPYINGFFRATTPRPLRLHRSTLLVPFH